MSVNKDSEKWVKLMKGVLLFDEGWLEAKMNLQ